MTDSAKKTTLNGSCKCGFAKYKVDLKVDADGGCEATRCNCTFCTKLATTYAYLDGPQDFHLLEPDSADKLGAFAPRVKTLPRYFCQHCGSQVFTLGYYEHGSDRHDITGVNIATIDQPQGNFDLNKVKFTYFNMLNNSFGDKGPKAYANGLI